MTKVDINGTNHQVTIEVDHADLGYVIDKARKLYEETKPPERGLGPAYGFSMERKPQPAWDRAVLGVERLPVRVEAEG